MKDLELSQKIESFGDLYLQIGILEQLLRVRVPNSLSFQNSDSQSNSWLDKIPLNSENTLRLERAYKRRILAKKTQSVNVTEFLPFSFWRWVLHRQHFTNLWIPHTHKILVDTKEAQNYKTFTEFEKRLNQANQDRNVIAHYNFSAISSMEKSTANIQWLQQAMGLIKT